MNAVRAPQVPPPIPLARVLVIEDYADLREITCRILTLKGYQVESAADGLAGIELFRAGGFDAVSSSPTWPPNRPPTSPLTWRDHSRASPRCARHGAVSRPAQRGGDGIERRFRVAAVGATGLGPQFSLELGGARGVGGRLEDDRIARGKSRCDFVGDGVQR